MRVRVIVRVRVKIQKYGMGQKVLGKSTLTGTFYAILGLDYNIPAGIKTKDNLISLLGNSIWGHKIIILEFSMTQKVFTEALQLLQPFLTLY